jgi:peptidoglycan/LPS O-acetylase OafA/YrhL
LPWSPRIAEQALAFAIAIYYLVEEPARRWLLIGPPAPHVLAKLVRENG